MSNEAHNFEGNIEARVIAMENTLAKSLRLVSESLKQVATSNDNLATSNKALSTELQTASTKLEATTEVLKNSVPVKIVGMVILAIIVGRNLENIGELIKVSSQVFLPGGLP